MWEDLKTKIIFKISQTMLEEQHVVVCVVTLYH